MSKMNMTYSEAIVFCRYSHPNPTSKQTYDLYRLFINKRYCLYWRGVTILMTDVRVRSKQL
jgi:hypothetical protein